MKPETIALAIQGLEIWRDKLQFDEERIHFDAALADLQQPHEGSQWTPLSDGIYWDAIRVRAVHVDGAKLRTCYDYDDGCVVELTPDVRLCRLTPADGSRWVPVSHAINEHGMELYADELAVTIAQDNIGMATFAWPEERRFAVCERLTPAAPATGVDVPDSPGWFAFEGHINIGNKGKNVLGPYGVYKHDDFWVAQGVDGTYLVQNMVGTWHKLTMPWDSQR